MRDVLWFIVFVECLAASRIASYRSEVHAMADEFSRRLSQACDDNPLIPAYGQGRQAHIAKRLKVTQEAVRKWFSGESRPKPKKMSQLATLLESDEAWLSLGIKPEIDRKQKRAHGEQNEGAVFFLFGLCTMAGATCAFPANPSHIDFYAIYKGVQYPMHVSVGRETSKGVYEFYLPKEYNETRCIGVVPLGHTRFHFIHLQQKLIDAHKQKKAGGYAVTLNRKGSEYHTGADQWPKFETMGDLS